MQTFLFAGALLAGCSHGGSKPTLASPPLDPPVLASVAIAPAAAAVAPASTTPTPSIPRFAMLDVKLDEEFPLRGVIRHHGSLYYAHDDAPAWSSFNEWNDDDRGNAMLVLDVDAATSVTARRPRLLCNDGSHRVALYVDAGALGSVVRLPSVATSKAELPTSIDETTPGFRFPSGAEITRSSEKPGLVRAQYNGFALSGAG